MEIKFNFSLERTALGSIDIEDIGNCALECISADIYYYYIVIRTSLGKTAMFTCGPIVPDTDSLIDGFTSKLNIFNFNADRIKKGLDYFINDSHKITITKINKIDFEEASKQFKNLGDYLLTYGVDWR